MRHELAVLQSNYLPWKGYFDIIHDVETFIFYDDVQFTKNDWRNRNRIKALGGAQWLTVPVGQSESRLVCEVTLEDAYWQKKHWKTLVQNYSRTPYFSRYTPLLEHIYLERRWTSLSQLNQFLIRTICTEYLGIKTQFRDSREFSLTGSKFNRLLDLLLQSGAKSYLSGPAAADYIDPGPLASAGISLAWKIYDGYPEYSQFHPPFDHFVSILDLLFHTGTDAPWFIWGWRTDKRT